LTAQHTHQKKPRLRDRTDRAYFGRLLPHPARKRSGSIFTTSDVKASRPDWPRGQNFGLGLDKLVLASISSIWPRLASVLLTWSRKMRYPVQKIGCIHLFQF